MLRETDLVFDVKLRCLNESSSCSRCCLATVVKFSIPGAGRMTATSMQKIHWRA